jgi:phage repressor protein C with HTH and peptisase S24 domain
MLRHQDLWQAIDRLAEVRGFSPSGLARRAGLDPTTFNRSKRIAQDGRLRWPSTESIAKVLEATEATLSEFVALVSKVPPFAAQRHLPFRSCDGMSISHFDQAGNPTGAAWDRQPFPDLADRHAYALAVSGDGLEPVYRDGDRLVVSPEAPLRKGDRVVVLVRSGETIIRSLIRRGAQKLELAGLTPTLPARTLPIGAVAFIHRIVWVSQ